MEISLSTSNWKEIVGMMIGETVPQNYDNPAFEWNNLQNIQKFQNFNVQTIFHEFKFSAIYAPCINFKGKFCYKNFCRILFFLLLNLLNCLGCFVCGAALEFNCISDIELNFGVIQLALGINIMNQIQSFIASTSIIDEKTELEMEHSNKENIHEESLNSNWSERRLQKSLSFTDKKSFDDSGVDSLSYSNKKFNEKRSCKRKTSSRLSNKQAVPYEIGFVSGKFTIKCIVSNFVFYIFFFNDKY